MEMKEIKAWHASSSNNEKVAKKMATTKLKEL